MCMVSLMEVADCDNYVNTILLRSNNDCDGAKQVMIFFYTRMIHLSSTGRITNCTLQFD